jgi:putative hydrolase of the HAD superfamily
MIRAVLFDLGGTLLDNADPFGWSEVVREMGIDVDPYPMARAYREVQAEFDATDLPESAEFWHEVLQRATGRPIPEGTARRFEDRWFASGEHRPPLFPDVHPCLEALETEGVLLGLVSNSRSEAACRAHLGRLGIQRYFPVVVSSGTEGVRKPDAEIFRRGVRRVGVEPREALYVGDLPFTDARGAEAAGLHGLWLDRHGRGSERDPPAVSSLTEVPHRRRQFDREPSKDPLGSP